MNRTLVRNFRGQVAKGAAAKETQLQMASSKLYGRPSTIFARGLLTFGVLLTVLLAVLITFQPITLHAAPARQEVTPVPIPLAGPIASANAEISSLAWYGDWLVLLPQFPWWETGQRSEVYILPRQEILDFLDGKTTGPLTPRGLPLNAPGIANSILGFEGFEAIAFWGDQLFVTVEADLGSSMQGWLLTGTMAPDLSGIWLDVESRVAIAPQASFINMSDEAIVVRGGAVPEVWTFYEVNGRLSNRKPVAHRFDRALRPLESLPMSSVEYRITDATEADETGRFWVSNYFWPGEVQILLGQLPNNPLLRAIMRNAQLHPVERLVELQITAQGIRFTNTRPISLALQSDGVARNWEGLVRLGNRGFLLATDKFPTTILAFVPYTSNE